MLVTPPNGVNKYSVSTIAVRNSDDKGDI